MGTHRAGHCIGLGTLRLLHHAKRPPTRVPEAPPRKFGASMSADTRAITRLLVEWRSVNKDASARLMELVYRELRQIASGRTRRERGQHTLQTTALVHEAYIRLCGAEPIQWQIGLIFSPSPPNSCGGSW
jgi:hypothetical protein